MKGIIKIHPIENLLQRSIDNVRLSQIQEKVNLEAEVEYARKYIGSPMPQSDFKEYMTNISEGYLKSKIKYLW